VRAVRETGQAPFGLRPEFTPTLARMYAARAAQLPKPTKWFMSGPFFRAERPQRGRLREFLQWNVDFIGGDGTVDEERPALAADFEVLSCCVSLLREVGLSERDVRVKINFRDAVTKSLARGGVAAEKMPAALDLLDRMSKLDGPTFDRLLAERGLPADVFAPFRGVPVTTAEAMAASDRPALRFLHEELSRRGIAQWCELDHTIVRGLAYYTGMVFEVHEASGAERAIAGGGRYDNLIEMFGGPPTPAVGFGMGDVVLGNILQDRGLMPEGAALLERLSEPGASYRPDVFVLANGTEEAEAQVRPLVARLRRERLHARHSSKATKNIGKLLQEASAAAARFAVIVESADRATVKDLSSREERKDVPLANVGALVSGGATPA
jgi:histidyl-tRNA synthetase